LRRQTVFRRNNKRWAPVLMNLPTLKGGVLDPTANKEEMYMLEFSYTITDPNGIHARPAGLFVQKMQGYKSRVMVNRGDQSADAKKLIALMKLRLKCGQTFTVHAEGEDEAEAVETARDFLTANL
jgi:phosphotransferase system HPr (HPr) family protein